MWGQQCALFTKLWGLLLMSPSAKLQDAPYAYRQPTDLCVILPTCPLGPLGPPCSPLPRASGYSCRGCALRKTPYLSDSRKRLGHLHVHVYDDGFPADGGQVPRGRGTSFVQKHQMG